MKTYSVGDE